MKIKGQRLRSTWGWLALAGGLGIGGAVFALSPSSFESADGNMVVNTAGNEDWANAPNLSVGDDIVDAQADDAFGQGSKEDLPNPSVVDGSIPPNKSNLTHFYVSSEMIGSDLFLYLGWTRSNVLGTVNLDFEFNQSTTLESNGITPVRTAGDILITYDFANGGSRPLLGMLTWVTSGGSSQCFSAHKTPCWGHRVDLSTAGFADGQVYQGSTPGSNPISNETFDAFEFGEAAIDLTAAIPSLRGQCTPFASAFVKSRSSDSFTAELKDFIAPIPTNFATCGNVNIHKVDDNGAALPGAVFTLLFDDAGTPDGTVPRDDGGTFTCTSANNGNCSMTQIPFGTYWVSETTVPSGFTGGDDQGPFSLPTADGGVTASFTFVNTRNFRVFTYVCREGANTLYPSQIKLDDGGTLTSLSAADAVNAGLDETTLCTTTEGAHFNGRKIGDHPGNVNIPDAGP